MYSWHSIVLSTTNSYRLLSCTPLRKKKKKKRRTQNMMVLTKVLFTEELRTGPALLLLHVSIESQRHVVVNIYDIVAIREPIELSRYHHRICYDFVSWHPCKPRIEISPPIFSNFNQSPAFTSQVIEASLAMQSSPSHDGPQTEYRCSPASLS